MQPDGERVDLDLLENTETEPDLFAISSSRSVHSGYRRAGGLLVLSALVMAVAGALITRQAISIREGGVSEAAAVSVVVPGFGGGWTRWHHTGCHQWRSISLMEPKTGLTLTQCQAECLDHLMCGSINYQTGSSCEGQGISPGACYIFVVGDADEHGLDGLVCGKHKDTCWDFYARPGGAPVVMPSPRLKTACDNVDDIGLGERHQVWSKYECFESCRTTSDCTAFSHEPGQHIGSPDFCRLMKDGCQMKREAGMDLYLMEDVVGPTLAPTPAPASTSAPTSAPTPIPTAAFSTTAKPEPASSTTAEPEPASSTTAKLTPNLGCVVGASTCHESWTEEQKTQCCSNEEFCCGAATHKEIFDCSDFDKPDCHSSWTDGQKVVCGKKGFNCQGPTTTDANAAK
jgi:hypothetical protein